MIIGIVGGRERNEALLQRMALHAGHYIEFHRGDMGGRGCQALESLVDNAAGGSLLGADENLERSEGKQIDAKEPISIREGAQPAAHRKLRWVLSRKVAAVHGYANGDSWNRSISIVTKAKRDRNGSRAQGELQLFRGRHEIQRPHTHPVSTPVDDQKMPSPP